MLQYLIILLDDTSVSYCHCDNPLKERRFISLDDLKAGILFAMKENLMIQFVYPDCDLPEEYKEAIETIDHSNIMPLKKSDGADVVVLDSVEELGLITKPEIPYVLRCTKDEFFANAEKIAVSMADLVRLNIVVTDIETLKDSEQHEYSEALRKISEIVESAYLSGKNPQTNILTDRMVLNKMNNCNAGDENITLAPNGKFYVCPAFYYDEQKDEGKDFFGKDFSIGDLAGGLKIKNKQLYKLDFAPICRICDAYQCKRCVWLNRKTTLEVNTPSHEQCVAAHLERNASRALLQNLKSHKINYNMEIKEIDYLDPFEITKR